MQKGVQGERGGKQLDFCWRAEIHSTGNCTSLNHHPKKSVKKIAILACLVQKPNTRTSWEMAAMVVVCLPRNSKISSINIPKLLFFFFFFN